MVYSVALIVPAALQDKANRLACALGYDTLPGSTYNVPLSATGTAPATHYGTHTWAEQPFVDVLSAAVAGTVPTLPLAENGLSAEDVTEVLSALSVSVQPRESFATNWQGLLTAQNLRQVAI